MRAKPLRFHEIVARPSTRSPLPLQRDLSRAIQLDQWPSHPTSLLLPTKRSFRFSKRHSTSLLDLLPLAHRTNRGSIAGYRDRRRRRRAPERHLASTVAGQTDYRRREQAVVDLSASLVREPEPPTLSLKNYCSRRANSAITEIRRQCGVSDLSCRASPTPTIRCLRFAPPLITKAVRRRAFRARRSAEMGARMQNQGFGTVPRR